jgi:putative CocE/NonD family hydrolase
VRIVIASLCAVFGAVLPVAARADGPPASGRVYFTADDGVELAVYLEYPPAWNGTDKLPAILQYDGYDGGGDPAWHTWLDRDHYVIAHAGVRGAGCSGGQWSFFSDRQARDGAEIVDWLATRQWSNGNVGMVGHSYPGYMALFTAAQRPAHLRAITVSGTGDDIYRDVAYPGGIPSRAFGPAWLLVARPEDDYLATLDNTQQGKLDCAEHHAMRPPENPGENSLVNVLLQDQDSDFWVNHSPKSVVDRIAVPTQINAQSGDEQILGSTRGSGRLFQALPVADKQLLITNGDHNTWDDAPEPVITQARMAWLDHFVRGVDNGIDAQPRIRFLLESHYTGDGSVAPTGEVSGTDFPLPATQWQTLYANTGNALTALPASAGTDTFVMGTHRQITDPETVDSGQGSYVGQEVFWADGPDSVVYRTPPASQPVTIAGPILATLYARIASFDADWYVSIQDEAPDGARSLLTRGFLRASHRAVDPARQSYAGSVLYRTFHPHTNPTAVTPQEITEYQVEVFPAAFVLRPGHVLRLVITATPLQETFGVFQPNTPTVAEILHDAGYPTRVLLPVVSTPDDLGTEPACGSQTAVFCAHPVN